MSTGPSVRTIAIILLGAILVFTGNGLLQTMLPMRADLEHFSTAMIGLQGTAYFGGFIAGCVMDRDYKRPVCWKSCLFFPGFS